MKALILIVFVSCCTSKFDAFSQSLFQKNIRNKEALEIAYIVDCIKADKSADSLIGWKFSSEYDDNTSYRHKRDRLAFFKTHKNQKGAFLQSIEYYHRSYRMMVFSDGTPTDCEVNGQTRFRVWMSKDKLSVYFCVINRDKVMIWVLSSGNNVYTVQHIFS